jgi:hypothetical protein
MHRLSKEKEMLNLMCQLSNGGGSGIRFLIWSWRKHVIRICYSYLLSANDDLETKPDFGDRMDIKGRFNAKLGECFQFDPNGCLPRIGFRSKKFWCIT